MAVNKKYQRKIQNKTKKVAKKIAKKHPVLAFFLAIIFIAIVIGGYYAYNKYFKEPSSDNNQSSTPIVALGDISFHFMMLGNEYSGDSIYIKAGDNDILIDAGSRNDSSDDIIKYVDTYCDDKTLEYVIATHADRDHIACFGCNDGIFDYYDCKTIIDFPLSKNQTDESPTKVYKDYIEKRNKEVSEGAKLYNALECYNEINGGKKVYDLGNSVSMEILYNYYYENPSPDENNYSVCLLFKHGERKFLFTGDLEKEGEAKLVEKYPGLGQVELYKAGHHGSKTSSTNAFLQVIRPKICVVSCNTGKGEFTDTKENMFPTQSFIDRISSYTEKVYVTTLADENYTNGNKYLPMNGNVMVSSSVDGVTVNCSDNNTLLKDTVWFKENRITPSYWK